MIEQIELKFTKKFELFQKHLRIAGVTRVSVLRQEALDRETEVGQDIQLTVLGENPDRKRAAKYFHMSGGYLDTSKRILEINTMGAVAH